MTPEDLDKEFKEIETRMKQLDKDANIVIVVGFIVSFVVLFIVYYALKMKGL